ncbi:hypothetical protein PoB_002540300 [Plakobranchus ocellatus]|uniref:Uncharacterized protein n=1 Tax=Plakobranchus ocellatus TaxID=259542 RepID=A0AAV3ZVJ7_9GAST|nr:hypothetical protein PoB_002540300 [Plakobranchus ocellatus]
MISDFEAPPSGQGPEAVSKRHKEQTTVNEDSRTTLIMHRTIISIPAIYRQRKDRMEETEKSGRRALIYLFVDNSGRYGNSYGKANGENIVTEKEREQGGH